MTQKPQPRQPSTEEGLVDGYKFQLSCPEYAAASTCNYLQLHKEASQERSATLLAPLVKQMKEIKQGDLTEVERILYSQSVTLQTAFNRFMGIAALSQDNAETCDRYASLALRAQEQCRKTLATLVDLKNPKKPAQFIKNYVDKQLNQLRVEGQDNANEPTPLQLEATQNAKVDIGSTPATGGTDLELETVGKVDGTCLGRGQGD
jgi:hypothetical protein